MCVTSLLCGLWADLWPLMGCAVNGFSLDVRFTFIERENRLQYNP